MTTVKFKSNNNNNGKGWYFQYADGFHGWIFGMSVQEKKRAEMEHGKLVKWVPAN